MRKVVLLQNILAPYRVPLFNELARRVDLTVLVSAETERRRSWDVDSLSKVFTLQKLAGFTIRRSYEREVQISTGLVPALSRLKPDAVICSGFSLQTAQSLIWSRRTRTALIVWTESPRHERRRLRTRMARSVDAFVVAGSLSRAVLEEMGVPECDIFEAFNSVDTQVYRPHAIEAGSEIKLNFLFVGHLIERKGLKTLAEASSSLIQRGIPHSVTLVGNGPLAPWLQRTAEERALAWQFPGWMEPSDVALANNSATAAIVPSLYDCNPLTLVESLCCGTPVIASDGVGSARDHIVPGHNGEVFSAGDADALARAMARFANGAAAVDSRDAIAAAAHARFSPESAADSMVAAVEYALGQQRCGLS